MERKRMGETKGNAVRRIVLHFSTSHLSPPAFPLPPTRQSRVSFSPFRPSPLCASTSLGIASARWRAAVRAEAAIGAAWPPRSRQGVVSGSPEGRRAAETFRGAPGETTRRLVKGALGGKGRRRGGAPTRRRKGEVGGNARVRQSGPGVSACAHGNKKRDEEHFALLAWSASSRTAETERGRSAVSCEKRAELAAVKRAPPEQPSSRGGGRLRQETRGRNVEKQRHSERGKKEENKNKNKKKQKNAWKV